MLLQSMQTHPLITALRTGLRVEKVNRSTMYTVTDTYRAAGFCKGFRNGHPYSDTALRSVLRTKNELWNVERGT